MLATQKLSSGTSVFTANAANYYDLGTTNYNAAVNTVTLCAWVKIYDLINPLAVAGKNNATTATASFSMDIVAGNTRFQVASGGSEAFPMSPQKMIPYRWYHCCGVYDGTTVYTYVNGALMATSAFSGNLNTSSVSFLIGRHAFSGSGSYAMNGKIAHVGIWLSALNGEEIANLANGVMPHLIRPGVNMGYYPLGVYGGRDFGSQSRNATLVGTVPNENDNPPTTMVGFGYGGSEAPPQGGGTDATTVYLDITTTGVEVVGIAEVGTVYVDIQASGPDGVTHFDAATVYADISIHTCEWYVPKLASEFIWAEYTKWSYAASTKWSISATTKWRWDTEPVDNTPVEICS